MNELSAGTLEAIYLSVIGLLTILLVWNGWRQGVARQLMTLLAIVGGYLVGWYAGPSVAPMLAFLRYPEPVLRILGGVVAGLAAFIGIRTLRLLFFKRTAQFESIRVRRIYGFFGALVGLLFGAGLLLFSSDAIRMLGSVANMQVRISDQDKQARAANPNGAKLLQVDEPNPLIKGLAKLSDALNNGSTGKFIQSYDPVPKNVYATIAKLAMMVSRQESLNRFLAYPGVEGLANHPKLTALRMDPTVGELLANNSYLKLLRHEKVVALASDPEFAAEIKKVNFEEALNAALKGAPGGEL